MSAAQTLLGTWDTSAAGWLSDYIAKSEWAQTHIERAVHTYRIEFWQSGDAPYAIIYRFAADENGRVRAADDGSPEVEQPVTVALTELPPAHLLEPPA